MRYYIGKSDREIAQPRPRSGALVDHDRFQTLSKSAAHEDVEGYQLRPIAYDPNPPSHEAEDPRQSWREGDDLKSMQTNPPDLPPPKPAKIPQVTRSDASQSPLAAPQLPPLYFEPQPQVEQQDFAYVKQPHQAGPRNGVSSRYNPLQPGSSTTPPAEDSRNGITQFVAPNTSQPQTQGDRPSQPTVILKQAVPKLNRKSPPLPVIATSDRNSNRTDERKKTEGDVEESNSSFYFHSPQSSTDSSNDRSPKVSAADNNAKFSSKTAPSDFGLSSASALGFGGPSDWEHFGDYEGEEIDDEDLYVSTKTKTAELPASTSPAEESNKQISTIQPGPQPETLPLLSTAGTDKLNRPSADSQAGTSEETLIPTKKEDEIVEEIKGSSTTSGDAPPRLPPFSEILITRSDGSGPKIEAPLDNHTDNIRVPILEQISALDEANQDEDVHSPAETKRSSNRGVQYEEASGAENIGTQGDNGPGVQNETDVGHEPDGPRSMDIPPQGPDKLIKHETSQILEDEKPNDKRPDRNYIERLPRVRESDQSIRDTNNYDGSEDIIISLQIPETPEEPLAQLEQRTDQSYSVAAQGSRASTLQSGLVAPESIENGASRRHSYFPKSIEVEDPYANLDAWAKASLNRYIKMLQEERHAETEVQKYSIFTNFTQRETRLRAILYDMDDEAEPTGQPVNLNPLKASTSIVTLRPNIKSKALPALPPGAQLPPPLKPREHEDESVVHSRSAEKLNTQAREAPEADYRSKSQQLGPNGKGLFLRGPSDESYVMVDSPVTGHNTSTGKDLGANCIEEENTSPLRVTPSLTSLRKALDVVGSPVGSTLTKDNGPLEASVASGAILAINDLKHTETQRSNSVPLPSVSDSGNDTPSIVSEKPAYTPFRYNEGRQYEGDKAENRQSIYRPFSMLLRQRSRGHASLYSGSDGTADQSDIPPVPSTPRDGMYSGVFDAQRRQAQALKNVPQPPARPPNQRSSILEPLRIVVPSSSVLRPDPVQLMQVRKQLEAVPDELGFIHETMLAWDAGNKQVRALNDRERHVRQGESEQRIDALFNENQIGYGDISELEAECKRSEAAKKAEEDRAEYQSFVSQVFEAVWARLHYEMDQLGPLYDTCVQMLNDATAGKEMFEDTGGRVPVAPAMECLLVLYQKLGIRHQKAFEAVLERDRRLKITEVAPWYALSNIGKVKSIEKRFEEAERKAILEFCHQRDERANLLMDVLDQNTLRGVGLNQDYMESVMQAVRKIALDVALSGVEDSSISTDEVLKAKTITASLARSSEQIVQTFHVADMLLNAADYEVSVANARLANADAAAFKRLREAKAKEDQKLVKDLEHRMSLIRGDTSRTQDEITKLLSLLGSSPSDSTPPRSTSAPADPHRESRLLAALEEAKRRNAPADGL